MEKNFFTVDQKLCNEIAMKYFEESAGMNRKGPKADRIREGGMRMRELLEEKIDIHAEYVFFSKDEFLLDGDKLTTCGQNFTCKAFEQIDTESLEGLFLYACCVGDYAFPDEDILNQVYADIWGSAFSDSVRALIRKELEQHCRLSENFGPGFYGMSTRELGKLQQVLDFDKLGIEVRNNNIMIPLKSCAGLFFQINEQYTPIEPACSACYGNQSSCKLCQVFIDGHNDGISAPK